MTSRLKLDRASAEQNVERIVRELLSTLGGHRALAAVGPGAVLDRDLGLGSLERVELASRLEADFGVILPDTFLATAETVADCVEAILAGHAAPLRQNRVLGAAVPPSLISLAPPASASTLVEVLRLRAQGEPGRAHVYLQEEGRPEQVLGYGELWESASRVAAGFVRLGLGPGDTAALMLPTGTDFFFSFMGALIAGVVPVPLYPPFSMDRIAEYVGRQRAILESAEARILVTTGRGLALGRALRSVAPSLSRVVDVEDLCREGGAEPGSGLVGSSPAFIQYTSGSTGDPKGVLLSHANLLANIRALGEALDIRPTDVGASWLPLYHDMGLIGCWLTPLYFGIPVAILSPVAFLTRPEKWLWAIHARRATITAAPNFGYELAARRVKDEALEGLDLSCWRAALNGAEPVLTDTLERFSRRFARFGFRREAFVPVYGLAESTVALSVPPLDRPPRIERVARQRFETEKVAEPAPRTERQPLAFVSAGRPIPGHEVRIVDQDGVVLPERCEGRLEFRGPSSLQCYYRNPDATAAILKGDGWVDSGDQAFMADGEIFITGRVKDVVIRAGRNLYPQEIESLVGDVPGVRRGCVAAFGVMDPDEGTEKLVVVAETRVEAASEKLEIERRIQESMLETLGVPADRLLLAPPRAVPKTSSGKIRRSSCRDAFLAGKLGGRTSGSPALALRMGAFAAALQARRLTGSMARTVYAGYFTLLAATIGTPLWVLALLAPSRDLVQRALRGGARALLWLAGCRLRVEGIDHLGGKEGGPFVLAANHASYLDPLPLLAALPLPFAFVVKKEAVGWPVLGTFIRKLGSIPVEREDAGQSAADAERVRETLAGGRSVLVFPEGTFTRATGIRPFRLGAFKAAADSGRPLIPVALSGTRRWLRDESLIPRRSDLGVVLQPPIAVGATTLEALVRARDEAAEAIARAAGEPRLDLIAGRPPARRERA